MSLSEAAIAVFQAHHSVILGENHYKPNALDFLTTDSAYIRWLLQAPINIFHEALPKLKDNRHYTQKDLKDNFEQERISALIVDKLLPLNNFREIYIYGLECEYFSPFTHYLLQ